MKDVEAIIDDLRPGDIVAYNRIARVVREVHRKNGRVTHVTFAIRRCSWTRKGYTVRNRSDLYHVGLTILLRDYKLDSTPIEAMLQQEIDFNLPTLIECCDVIGVVP